jgi:hypothetical protein
MQLTGHPAAQAPQLMQVSGSITNFPPSSDIAPTGHVPAHEPQPIQESPITYAIFNFLLIDKFFSTKDDYKLCENYYQ